MQVLIGADLVEDPVEPLEERDNLPLDIGPIVDDGPFSLSFLDIRTLLWTSNPHD
jgi:hypothetical protein